MTIWFMHESVTHGFVLSGTSVSAATVVTIPPAHASVLQSLTMSVKPGTGPSATGAWVHAPLVQASVVQGFVSSHWAAEVQPPPLELLLLLQLELLLEVLVVPVPVAPVLDVLEPPDAPVPIEAANMSKFCVHAMGRSTIDPRARVERARIVARRTATSVEEAITGAEPAESELPARGAEVRPPPPALAGGAPRSGRRGRAPAAASVPA